MYNVGPTSSTLSQHCTNVIQIFCVHWVERSSQQTRGVEPGLVRCWASEQTVGKHWVKVVFARSVDKCFAPKRNNKFCLIHSLSVHRSHLITLITKAIDTTSTKALSTFMVMLLEGSHLQFFVHKKLDPSSFVNVMCPVLCIAHHGRHLVYLSVHCSWVNFHVCIFPLLFSRTLNYTTFPFIHFLRLQTYPHTNSI